MNVLDGNSGCLLRFVLEEVYKCGLRTFNLRGDDGLFAHKGVDKPVERRHHLAGWERLVKTLSDLGTPRLRKRRADTGHRFAFGKSARSLPRTRTMMGNRML